MDILYKVGFGSSYSMVIQFETSAALAYDTSTSDYGAPEEGQLQFVADNGDHNLRTLTGHGTVHGMGIMAVTTPATKKQMAIRRQPVYTAFQNGFHIMRRSDRFWAGISTVMMIEQVLMRSLKTSGVLQ